MPKYYTRLPVMLQPIDMKNLNIILGHLETTNKTSAIRHALQVLAGQIVLSTLSEDLKKLQEDEDDE